MAVVKEQGRHLEGVQQQANTQAGRSGVNPAAVHQSESLPSDRVQCVRCRAMHSLASQQGRRSNFSKPAPQQQVPAQLALQLAALLNNVQVPSLAPQQLRTNALCIVVTG
jgi:hypothetical protein